MMHFTQRALHCIEQAIASRKPTPRGLQLRQVGSPCSGLSYVIRLEQQPAFDEQVIECQGLRLFIDDNSFNQMQGVEIDYIEQGETRGFTFDHPSASSKCAGCGKFNAA